MSRIYSLAYLTSHRSTPAEAILIAAATGYQYVSLDLQGYRLGSLNEALRLRPVS